MADDETYSGREQTLVKHTILRDYLGRFAHIVGTFADSITYVDCFAGPWNVRSEQLDDSSFAIAIQELLKARDTLSAPGKKGKRKALRLRCFFLEKQLAAYQKLKQYCDSVRDIEIETKNSELAEAVPEILSFVHSSPGTFPFVFIDPTGWTGFEMNTIRPLLELVPAEVLITFMTGHLHRFATSPVQKTRQSVVKLFGNSEFTSRIEGLTLSDREDAMVQSYMDQVQKLGNFKHVCCSIVLHPEKDRTHFHLIYATRHDKGIEVFKGVERSAMGLMEKARAKAQQRKRERGRTKEMFSAEDMSRSTRYDELRERYLGLAKSAVEQFLRDRRDVLYDEVWSLLARTPLVWESDLKQWIKQWQQAQRVTIRGLPSRHKVPQRAKQNFLQWNAVPLPESRG